MFSIARTKLPSCSPLTIYLKFLRASFCWPMLCINFRNAKSTLAWSFNRDSSLNDGKFSILSYYFTFWSLSFNLSSVTPHILSLPFSRHISAYYKYSYSCYYAGERTIDRRAKDFCQISMSLLTFFNLFAQISLRFSRSSRL